MVHRSGIADFHARECSTAQELYFLTRGNGPPLRNSRIPRAVAVQPPENVESHAQEQSIAQKSQNSTCGSGPPLRNGGFLRAGRVHRSGDRKSTRLNSSHVSISYAV